MWFSQADILLLMVLCSAGIGAALRIAGRWDRQGLVQKLVPLADLAVIWYASRRLAVFYAGFVLVTFCFSRWLKRVRRGRKLWFALLCLGCMVPLVYTRAASRWSALPVGVTMVGIACGTLKAIDALYYTYRAGEKLPFLTYANYILFFPVLAAGPVFRYRDFVSLWSAPRRVGLEELTYAVKRIIRGLFSLLVLSSLAGDLLDLLAGQAPRLYISAAIPVASCLTLFFALAGCASAAIGMSALMGVAAPENFKRPYLAVSFTQLRRSWMATVSDWIFEHMYALFGARGGDRRRGAAACLAAAVAMGLWCGASGRYLAAGLALGVLLAAEELLGLGGGETGRGGGRWRRWARRFIVCYGFALCTLPFTLTAGQIVQVLGGFFRL